METYTIKHRWQGMEYSQRIRAESAWSESIAHDPGVYTVDDGTVAHGYRGPLTEPGAILDQYVSTYRAGDWRGNVDLTLRRDGEVIATRAITV